MYLSLLLIQESRDSSPQKGSASIQRQLSSSDIFENVEKVLSKPKLKNLKSQASVGAQELKIE
jgi:hypothetical protein